MSGTQVSSSPAKSCFLQDRVAQIYYKHGLFCSSHPFTVIFVTLTIMFISCYPLLHLPLLGSSSQQFSTPVPPDTSESDEVQKPGPRWFQGPPVGYVLQVVVKTAVSPWQQDLILMDAFRSPLAEVFHIMELVNNHEVTNSNSSVHTLSDICLQVSEPKDKVASSSLPQYGCLITSPALVWKQDLNRYLSDGHILKTIFQQKDQTSESQHLREILFGVPWKETGIKQLCVRNRQRVITYAVTIVFKELNLPFVHSLEDKLRQKFSALPYVDNATEEMKQTDIVHIHFQYQHSLAEFIPLGAIYVILFLYIYFSVKKIELVKSKWAISVSAVMTVVMSLLMSVGLCLWFGLNPTLNGSPLVSPRSSCMPSEILPYLVVVIGLENMLVLTKSVVSTPAHVGAKVRLAQGLSKEGWSITKNLFTELALLTFAFFTFVPAIQEFCLFAVVGLLSDFFLQLVFFATVLSIDIQRKEKSDLKKGVTENTNNWNASNCVSDRQMLNNMYRTRIGKNQRGIPIVNSSNPAMARVFASPSPILVKLPKRLRLVYFWARTRLVQRGLMLCLIIWIIVLVHKSGIVQHLTDNTTTIAERFQFLHSLTRTSESKDGKQSVSGDTKEESSKFFNMAAKLYHTKLLLWEQLPTVHWTTLFGYYNMSLSGRYISILPSIHLSVPVSPKVAVELRHPDDPQIIIHPKWQFLPKGSSSEQESGESTIEGPYHPSSPAEVGLAIALSVPSVVFIVYVFVVLYRCMCSKNYAEWRSSWSHHHNARAEDPNAFLIMETFPIKLQGHKQEIECIVTDENIVTTSSLAGDVRVWDATTGECINILNRTRDSLVEQKTNCYIRGSGSFSSDSTYGSSPPETSDPIPNNILMKNPMLDFTHSQNLPSPPASEDNPTLGYNFSRFVQLQETKTETVEKENPHIEGLMEEGHCVNVNTVTRSCPSNLSYQPIWCMGSCNVWLVIGCGSGRLELWNILTGRLCGTYEDYKEGVTAVKVSGHRVIVARINGVLECWHLEMLTERKLSSEGSNQSSEYTEDKAKLAWVHSVRAHTQPISVVLVEGGHIVTGSLDRLLKVFRCDTAMCIYTLHGHSGGISAIHVDEEGASSAVSGCQDGMVCVWDLMTGTCAYSLTAHRGTITALRTTPLYLISLGSDSRLRIWEKTQGHLLHTLYQPNCLCTNMELLSNNILVTAKEDHLVLWDVNNGEAVQVIMLGPGDTGICVHQLHRAGEAIICDFGRQLCVIYFPALAEKMD